MCGEHLTGASGQIRTGGFTDLQSGALDHSATDACYGRPGQSRTDHQRIMSPLL
jgi:hypothetical protein